MVHLATQSLIDVEVSTTGSQYLTAWEIHTAGSYFIESIALATVSVGNPCIAELRELGTLGTT